MSYEILKIERTNLGFDALIFHTEYKIKLWLKAELKDSDIEFSWRDHKFNWKKNSEIVRMLIQKDDDEFCDASASVLCYLENLNKIRVNDDFSITEVTSFGSNSKSN